MGVRINGYLGPSHDLASFHHLVKLVGYKSLHDIVDNWESTNLFVSEQYAHGLHSLPLDNFLLSVDAHLQDGLKNALNILLSVPLVLGLGVEYILEADYRILFGHRGELL